MKIVKYFFVGSISAAVDIGFFSLFAVFYGFSWAAVSVFTFTLATLTNYFLSTRFVFKSGVRYKKHFEIVGVFIVSGLALLVNQAVLYLAIDGLGCHLILSKVFATGIVFFWNYYGRNALIF